MNIGRRILAVLLIGVAPLLSWADDNAIRIHDAWIRAAPPGARMLAAYMKIVNLGDRPQLLTGASSPHFERVEMHNTVLEDGLARMVQQTTLEIPARSNLEFRPGGYHFMLVMGKAPLQVGDRVELNLSFSNGEQVSANAEVRNDSAAETGDTGHSGHMLHQH